MTGRRGLSRNRVYLNSRWSKAMDSGARTRTPQIGMRGIQQQISFCVQHTDGTRSATDRFRPIHAAPSCLAPVPYGLSSQSAG